MQIHRISFTASEFSGIPTNERALLVILAHALNEINTLNKLLAIATHFDHEPKWVAHAQSMQALILARVLIGKLNEAWIAVGKGYFASKLCQTYDLELDTVASAALAALKSYFGKTSLVNSVRNDFSFHYSLKQAAAPIPNDIPREDMSIYLNEALGNSLYLFAEVVMNVALMEGISPTNPETGLDRLISEMSEVIAHLNTFGHGLLVALLERHLGSDKLRQSMQSLETGAAPHYRDLKIPFFIDLKP